MEQYLEFAGNHPLIVGGFFVALGLLVAGEIARRTRGFVELSGPAAVRRINLENSVVLDVSSLADYNKGHIANARHMPLSQLQDPTPEIEKLRTSPILVVCKNGQYAPQAASRLKKLGVDDVAVLQGGMAQWRVDNLPVTRS